MGQKKCFYIVLKCPKTPFSFCERIGAFDSEDKAKKCVEEKTKKIDNDQYLLSIYKVEHKET